MENYGCALPPGWSGGNTQDTSPHVDVGIVNKNKDAIATTATTTTTTTESASVCVDTPINVSNNSRRNKSIGPELPPSQSTTSSIGPELPPTARKKSSIGPELPPSTPVGPQRPTSIGPVLCSPAVGEEDYDQVGPSLLLAASEEDVEHKRKINAVNRLSGIDARARTFERELRGEIIDDGKPVGREEWMTALPEENRKNFGMGARQFRRDEHKDRGDTSLWTDTPADKERKRLERSTASSLIDEVGSSVKRRKTAPVVCERDLKLRETVDAYNMSRRPQSLMDMHTKSSSSDKNVSHTTSRTEGRLFNPETDLVDRSISAKDRAKMVEQAKHFQSRFAPSGSKQFL